MTRVLVPVAVLEGETIPPGLVDLLSTMDVTVLGYHVLPEQTPPDQARAQFEERAASALDDLCEEFRGAGADADHRLVFTHDRRQSIDRIAAETDSRAYAISGATDDVDRMHVSLSGTVDEGRILEFVEDLIGDRDIQVTLLAAGNDVDDDLLEASRERLAAAGIDAESTRADGDPSDALVEAAADYDAIVMGERAPSLSSLLFGEETERVAAASVGPVIVVRSAGDVSSE